MTTSTTNTDTNTMTIEDKRAELKALGLDDAKIEAILGKTKSNPNSITLKVSAKGGVSLYGMGRFPVTLYKSQWDRLLVNAKKIGEFITAHESELAVKE